MILKVLLQASQKQTQKITYIARSKIDLSSSTKFKKLINLIIELDVQIYIQELLVDIELCFQNNKLYLFQVII